MDTILVVSGAVIVILFLPIVAAVVAFRRGHKGWGISTLVSMFPFPIFSTFLLVLAALAGPAIPAPNFHFVEQKIYASNGQPDDWFGHSVALSGDGLTALAGASHADVGANPDQGSADVFSHDGVRWSGQATLIVSDGAAGDGFGYAVALSGDGSTALVGAPYTDIGSTTDQGSVYIFTHSGTIWTQPARLTADDGALGDWFGYAVALSGDGAIALVGAPRANIAANLVQGAVYVFTYNGVGWTQTAKLTAQDGAQGDEFGCSLALAGDGITALVGADLGSRDYQGAAYVFTHSATTWTQQARLTASDGAAYDYFGAALALSGDTALVGAGQDGLGVNREGQGSAYVFIHTGTGWVQQAKLSATDGAAWDGFGASVALSGDLALVGAPTDGIGAQAYQGSAYIFYRSGNSWSQQAHLIASDGQAYAWFGRAVALSGDKALVGAGSDNISPQAAPLPAYFYTPAYQLIIPLLRINAP